MDTSDWYDTTPFSCAGAEAPDRGVQIEESRCRLDAAVTDRRLPPTADGWGAAVRLRDDTDRIGRVMRATTFANGTELADVDPEDLTAALRLLGPVRRELDMLESQVMMIARRQEMSWHIIGDALGLQSPQAAAQRWERLTGAAAPAAGALRYRVTALPRYICLA